MLKYLTLACGALLFVACSNPPTLTVPETPDYLTCAHVHEHCLEAAQYAPSIFSYIGRTHSCHTEYERCDAVGIEEYSAIWRFVCPSLVGTSTEAGR